MRLLFYLLTMEMALAAGPKIQFFLSTDCPISNYYAPGIQSICASHPTVACELIYEDLRAGEAAVRRHQAEYGYRGFSFSIDAARTIAQRAGATVTPEAVLFDATGKVRYRGRIDNFFAALGRPRRQATEHNLRDAVEAVLAGRPVAVPETNALGCYIVSPNVLEAQ